MADEVIKLLLDLGLSAQNAQDVVDKLDKLRTTTKDVAGGYEVLDTVIAKSGGVVGTYTVQLGKEDAELDKIVRSAMEATQAQKAMHEVLLVTADSATKVVGHGGMGGRGLLGMSYAFQDFTSVLSGGGGIARALGAVSNNIDQMAMSMGLSVANAAKLSFAFAGFSSALPILIPLFKDLWDAMGGEGKGPEPVIKALDAAEERLKRIRSELEKLLASTTDEEAETRKRFQEFYAGSGADILGGTAKALGATGRGAQMTDQDRADIAKFPILPGMSDEDKATAMEYQQRQRDRVQDRINRENLERAGQIFGASTTDKGARDTMRALAGAVPGAFPKGFAGQMGELEPGAVRAQDEDVAATEAGGQAAIEAGRRRRKAAADRKKADEEVAEAERTALGGVGELERAEARSRGGAAAGATREAAARAARDKLPTPSAAQLRKGDEALWQREAVGLEQRAGQGGMTPAIMQRLHRLEEKLGKDMPKMEEAMMALNLSQNGMVSNQATFDQIMAEAKRRIAQTDRTGRSSQQTAASAGWW